MHKIFLITLLSLLAIGCDQNRKLSDDKNPLQDSLIGDWEAIIEIDSNQVYIEPLYPASGYSFSKDSIDFFQGFFNFTKNDSTGLNERNYLGNFKNYKIEGSQLFTENHEKKWQKFWKIKHLQNDTLFIINDDKSIGKLKRLKYKFKTEKDFDKIIYSSSSCYGRCPIIDISLDREGNIFYQGIAYANKIGFYKGKLNQETTDYIFKKFEKANIITLKKDYSATHTDDQAIMTTFIKNGKIIKSIYDYGREAPNELVWAYVPLGNIYNTTKINKVATREYFPNIKPEYFTSENLKLYMEDSEAFFLWTELYKSTEIEIKFIPKYELSYYYYLSMNEEYEKMDIKKNLKKITSDGRYYKFEFKNKHEVTYDLGYNFIERNFKETDFRKE